MSRVLLIPMFFAWLIVFGSVSSQAGDFEIVKKGSDTVLVRYHGHAERVVIPSGVTKIGIAAFEGCKTLTSVVIPNGVREIDDCAFADCRYLGSVTIPEGVLRIGGLAFKSTGLSHVVIPDGVKEIGGMAFAGCKLQLVDIPGSVQWIGGFAFDHEVIIRGPRGSGAEYYAKRSLQKFIAK